MPQNFLSFSWELGYFSSYSPFTLFRVNKINIESTLLISFLWKFISFEIIHTEWPQKKKLSIVYCTKMIHFRRRQFAKKFWHHWRQLISHQMFPVKQKIILRICCSQMCDKIGSFVALLFAVSYSIWNSLAIDRIFLFSRLSNVKLTHQRTWFRNNK